MVFKYTQKVLFKYCDPAGIVFFPRYFEMMSDCAEAFFDTVLDWPFENLLHDGGIPTANIATQFRAPSYHGDVLTLNWAITRLGRTSLEYGIHATCDAQLRFETTCTLVYISPDGRPAPWPDHIRAKLIKFMEGQS